MVRMTIKEAFAENPNAAIEIDHIFNATCSECGKTVSKIDKVNSFVGTIEDFNKRYAKSGNKELDDMVEKIGERHYAYNVDDAKYINRSGIYVCGVCTRAKKKKEKEGR